jgi:hypothetical protein
LSVRITPRWGVVSSSHVRRAALPQPSASMLAIITTPERHRHERGIAPMR